MRDSFIETNEIRTTTDSPWASWSWYDVARITAGAAAGGALGAVVAYCLSQELRYDPIFILRIMRAALLLAVAGVCITGGIAVTSGHFQRARARWLRQSGRALVVIAALSVIVAIPAAIGLLGQKTLVAPIVGWPLLGIGVGFACHIGFPREWHRKSTMLGGLLAGLGIAIIQPALTAQVAALPVAVMRQLAIPATLLIAGALFGLSLAIVREYAKRAWLLVIFGDHPGRHYPLDDAPFTIGSALENDLVLDPTGQVKPHHAAINYTREKTSIATVDYGALVHTSDRIVLLSDLFDGDEFQIGETVLRYYVIP